MMIAKTDATHCPYCGAELEITGMVIYSDDDVDVIEWHECPACGWQDRER